jgi:hypothetical protein
MASLLDDVALANLRSEQPSWLAAGEFFFGPPPSRFDLVKGELVSVFELFRERRAEARLEKPEPAFVFAVLKLATFLAVAIVLTGFLLVSVGSFVVRAALGFVG